MLCLNVYSSKNRGTDIRFAQVLAVGNVSAVNAMQGVGLNPIGGIDLAPVANCKTSANDMFTILFSNVSDPLFSVKMVYAKQMCNSIIMITNCCHSTTVHIYMYTIIRYYTEKRTNDFFMYFLKQLILCMKTIINSMARTNY